MTAPGWRGTRAPAARSIRSVWSRVASGSTTVVSPSASSPASSTHDFTCAEATGSSYVMPVSGLPPSMVIGAQPSVEVITAPIRPSGSAMRSTGRRRIDSSPSSV